MSEPFNPLDMTNLGLSITTAMLTSDPTPLSEVKAFSGAGIYAIYYRGDHPAYKVLSELNAENHETPIYVGKAVPSGGRKGLVVATSGETKALSARIREHAKSVERAENLDLAHFWCRWLVVEPIWIPLGESILISRSAPVWNALVDGFGNHDPGKGRVNGVRSRWDTLHPGRPWAPKYPPRAETGDDIAADVAEYLRARFPA